MENKFTEKVIFSINRSVEIAKEMSSPDVDVPHLLKAIYEADDSLLINILKRLNSGVL